MMHEVSGHGVAGAGSKQLAIPLSKRLLATGDHLHQAGREGWAG